MLFQLGAVQFEVAPLNADQSTHVTGASFAEHAVVGAMPPLEFMGESAETLTLSGVLFPKAFGGLAEVGSVETMRRSGQAQFLMRGDGTPFGWYVVETVRQTSTRFHRDGVGRVIQIEISLKKSQGPSADGVFNALWSLFS